MGGGFGQPKQGHSVVNDFDSGRGHLIGLMPDQPSPEVAAGSMEPLMEAVAAAQSEGALRPAPVEMVAFAIWARYTD
jgi:hypothetical protein